jgi:hypothetical protein
MNCKLGGELWGVDIPLVSDREMCLFSARLFPACSAVTVLLSELHAVACYMLHAARQTMS